MKKRTTRGTPIKLRSHSARESSLYSMRSGRAAMPSSLSSRMTSGNFRNTASFYSLNNFIIVDGFLLTLDRPKKMKRFFPAGIIAVLLFLAILLQACSKKGTMQAARDAYNKKEYFIAGDNYR